MRLPDNNRHTSPFYTKLSSQLADLQTQLENISPVAHVPRGLISSVIITTTFTLQLSETSYWLRSLDSNTMVHVNYVLMKDDETSGQNMDKIVVNTCKADLNDFKANVFTFTVTVRPYNQRLAFNCFSLQCLLYATLSHLI